MLMGNGGGRGAGASKTASSSGAGNVSGECGCCEQVEADRCGVRFWGAVCESREGPGAGRAWGGMGLKSGSSPASVKVWSPQVQVHGARAFSFPLTDCASASLPMLLVKLLMEVEGVSLLSDLAKLEDTSTES